MKYTPTIGIECHVQLKTATKLFSAVSNDAREASPNTLISHIDLGMPGALPVLNEKAVEFAAKMGFALNVEPQKSSYFERKHYFYPDLPKGYQITQLSAPIMVGGYVELPGKELKVRINRVQIEEDAGKSSHPAGKDYSLVDLNRAGTPLLEIVSEADMHSAEEAKAYAKELYLIVRYLDISDADMYQGNMRFDVNVSVSPDDSLGTRSETKNLNSFRSVEKAVEYEIKRQTELLEKGQKIVQETRGWDDAKQKTFSQRTKEEAEDYRYFPEPDVPPVELDAAYLSKVKTSLPVLPEAWRHKLVSLGLDDSQTATLIEAQAEQAEIIYLGLIEENLSQPEFAKALANWFVNIEIPLRREAEAGLPEDNDQRQKLFTETYTLSQAGKLSSTAAKSLLTALLKTGTMPENFEAYAAEQGYIQVSDSAEIEKFVTEVIAENQQAAEDVKNGEAKATQFLVGQVMKKSLGKANPQIAQELIKKQLEVN